MYQFTIDQPIPASSIGDTFTISSVSESESESYVGSYVYIGSTNSTNIIRLIYTGSLSNPPPGPFSGGVGNCGSMKGANLSVPLWAHVPAAVPVLKVEGLSNVPMATCWKHWLSLSNCSNAVLNNKIHRIMGADSTTSAYVNASAAVAYETALLSSLTLPDYGEGGSPGSIKAYEAAASVRLAGRQTCVKNVLSWASQGPAFVMDGNGGATLSQQTMSDCAAWGSNAGPAFCLYINDGVFWYYVRGFYGSNSPAGVDSSTCPASMLLTCTDNNVGQYCGIGRIEDVELQGYGVVVMPEMGTVVGNKIVNLIQEGAVDYPGTSWNAVVTLMPASGGVSDLELSDVTAADSGQYLIESLLSPLTALGGGAQIGAVQNIVIDNPSFAGTFPPYGPNLSASNVPLLNDFGSLQSGTFNFSGRSRGLYDTIEVGAQDSFAPVITLPAQFKIPLPPLLTVADWEALPGGCTFSTTDPNGNPLWGPDMSLGRVIQIHSPSSTVNSTGFDFVTVATWKQLNTNVGDLMLFYARVKNPNPASSLSVISRNNALVWNNHTVYVGNGSSNVGVNLLDPQVNPAIFERTGSLWTDVVNVWPVTYTGAGTGTRPPVPNTHTLTFGGGADDLIIDPESIAIYYIPVSGSFDTITTAEKQRRYRKVRSQVGTATPGDVAVPSRTGISFGAAARTGALPPLNTTTTSATPIYTYPVPASGAFQIEFSWLAVQPDTLSATSSGVCTVSGYNSSGTLTVSSVNTLGTNYNTGSGGAAAATPVTVTTGPGAVTINVAAESASSTNWQGFVKVLNVS